MSKKFLNYRYEYIEDIGKGGMATVSKAKDSETGNYVAIKKMDKSLLNKEYIKRFKREEFSMAILNHPNIVKLFDCFIENDCPCIVMEYIDGGTLDDLISDKGKIDIKNSINIILKISSALKLAHENNIVHRDIKPSNILMMNDGIPKLSDFGISKVLNSSRITKTDQIIGTCTYLSPEQARGVNVKFASDIYSLGVVFFKMVTGKIPFESDNEIGFIYKHLYEKPKLPSDLFKDIPSELDKIIIKMLEKRVEDRYENIDLLIKELEDLLYKIGDGKGEHLSSFKKKGKNNKNLPNSKTVVIDRDREDGNKTVLLDEKAFNESITITVNKNILKKEIQQPKIVDIKGIKFVYIKEGDFIMGSSIFEKAHEDNETQHKVIIKEFYMSVNVITIKQFNKFIKETNYVTEIEKAQGKKNWKCDTKGLLRKNLDHPVLYVSWNDAKEYCKWLSTKTNKKVRLPTEAEWEYSCRAGTEDPFSTGDNLTTTMANYNGNLPYDNQKGEYFKDTKTVGSYPANPWGLHEMHGNIWEWCEDWYDENYYDKCKINKMLINLKGPDEGLEKVLRGGSWYSGAARCRSAYRSHNTPSSNNSRTGFRVVYIL